MPELRLVFKRDGAARYLSHLDVFRTFARAFTRAEVPLVYSQGFNPHPYISIVHPLSVGVSGDNEILDFSINTFDVPDASAVNSALPPGLQVVALYTPARSVKEIAFAEYLFEFAYDETLPSVESLNTFFKNDVITVTKRTKSGIKPINLREVYKSIVFTQTDSHTLTARALFSATNAPVNPKYFTAALEMSALKPDFARYKRLGFFDAELKPLR